MNQSTYYSLQQIIARQVHKQVSLASKRRIHISMVAINPDLYEQIFLTSDRVMDHLNQMIRAGYLCYTEPDAGFIALTAEGYAFFEIEPEAELMT